jgi:aminoglycoside phosphotransferase (APT) family kinase protein
MSLTGRPVGTAAVPAVPHGHTALRLEWHFLPKEVRALVEDELGSPVVTAESRTSGFTPGFASVLTAESGAQVFVKAANKIAQAEIAKSYDEEIRKVVALADAVPAPRLEWFSREESWVLLGYEAVESRQPQRPWTPTDLTRALDLADEITIPADRLPTGLVVAPLVEDLPQLVTGWDAVDPGWPHREEAAALAASLVSLPAGHLVHADLRDDNILLAADGRTLACDWNWPALGSPWQDSLDLLISAHGDGVDTEAVLRSRERLATVDPDHVDAWLAGVTGFMLAASRRPVPPTSPYLRVHNRWTAEAAWAWLAQRRGW